MSTQVRPCLVVDRGGGLKISALFIYHYDPAGANMTVGIHFFYEKNECLTVLPQDEQGAALVFGVPSGVLRCGPTKTSETRRGSPSRRAVARHTMTFWGRGSFIHVS